MLFILKRFLEKKPGFLVPFVGSKWQPNEIFDIQIKLKLIKKSMPGSVQKEMIVSTIIYFERYPLSTAGSVLIMLYQTLQVEIISLTSNHNFEIIYPKNTVVCCLFLTHENWVHWFLSQDSKSVLPHLT